MVPLPWAKLKARGQRGRKALWVILYLASWIICSICFGINASNTIRAYFEGVCTMHIHRVSTHLIFRQPQQAELIFSRSDHNDDNGEKA